METIYAVVSGEYSDERVHALFLDKALAEQHAEQRNATKGPHDAPYEIAEYPLVREAPTRRVSYCGDAEVDENGHVEVTVQARDHWSYDGEPTINPEMTSYPRPWKSEQAVGFFGEDWDRERLLQRLNDRASRAAAEIAGIATP